ncbi:hypothetical protein NKI38_02730 [Mesorhizobium sp. M0621]|uniref:hypothetical protein n=1 Tax=Mesorhizobium sp. M0621 TaxID=2956974 RepID=UPI00333B328A
MAAFLAISARRSGVIFSALLSTLRAKRFGGRVFAVVNHVVGFLACGNAHDADGIADHVGWALLAFRSG